VLGNARLPGPFARVPIAWAIALLVFIGAGLTATSNSKSGKEQGLILAGIGVLLVLRGAMVFNQHRRQGEPVTNSPMPANPSVQGSTPSAAPASVLAAVTTHFSPPTPSVPDVPETVIVATDLSKRYGNIVAVDAVSFSVQRGEIFGLLGPNGAGKSTTLEMLEGLRDIDTGTALVLGTDVKSNAIAVKRRIGVQLQATALPSFTTVAESIDLFRAFYDHTRDTADLLVEFDLVPQAKQITTKLSGGQQQRCLLYTSRCV